MKYSLKISLVVLLLNDYALSAMSVLKKEDIEYLTQSRNTNLIIINDVEEYVPKQLLDPWFFVNTRIAPSVVTMTTALSTEQLVLCPKALWCTIQNLKQVWNEYMLQPLPVVIAHCQQKLKSRTYRQLIEQCKKEKLAEYLGSDVNIIANIVNTYDQFMLVRPEMLIPQYQSLMKEAFNQLYSVQQKPPQVYNELRKKFEDYKWLSHLLYTNACYQFILNNEYVCKEVTSDFILFVPRSYIVKHTNPLFQDLWLGLAYSQLPDYDYKKFLDDAQDMHIYQNVQNTMTAHNLGTLLVNALKKLKIDDAGLSAFMPVDQDLRLLQSPMNIFLFGHGYLSPTAEIAEISTQLNRSSESKIATSDFLKFLFLLNNGFTTKSLSILSCNIGGKHFVQTFDLKNQFDNRYLEQLTYPIIYMGSFVTAVIFQMHIWELLTSVTKAVGGWGLPDIMYRFPWFFYYLNQPLPEYEQAVNIFANIYNKSIDQVNQVWLSNYVSIKFPHTSWLSPVEIDRVVKKISQIDALTRKKPIAIDSVIQIILLSANLISEEIIMSAEFIERFPYFLPVAYHNQNYLIQKITAANLGKTIDVSASSSSFLFFDIMKYVLPLPAIKEPINIVIKELKAHAGVYKNIYAFSDYEVVRGDHLVRGIKQAGHHEQKLYPKCKVSGYIYTDFDGKNYMTVWLTHDLSQTYIYYQIPFDINILLQLIKKVERKATKNLKSFDAVSTAIAARNEQPIPKRVQDSRDEWERQNIAAKKIQTMVRKKLAKSAEVDLQG